MDYLKISGITKTDCQQVINNRAEHPRTFEKIKLTLNQIFKAAIDDDIITKNPSAKLELPVYRPESKRCLTEEEKNAFKAAKLSDMDRIFIDSLFYLGLCPGEAGALQFSSFNFNQKIVRIYHATNFKNNEVIYKDTKTHNKREVPLPIKFIEELKPYLETLTTPWLFPMRNGKLQSASSYRRIKEKSDPYGSDF